MHRASAADNPTAPLGHHTFDSTHIAYGVVTAAVDHGPWVLEGSLFNGREPDENRRHFELAPLDSFSGRVWYRPSDEWEVQASSGRLRHPEELDPGSIIRSTASASWTRRNGAAISSVTVGYGRTDTDHGARNALFLEGARHADLLTVYARFEASQVETGLLQTDVAVDGPAAAVRGSRGSVHGRAVRDVVAWRGFEGRWVGCGTCGCRSRWRGMGGPINHHAS